MCCRYWVLLQRNSPGCLIIVYDNDERLSREVCTALVDRGTENVFMLTGGLVRFGEEHPSYCEGEPPRPVVATPQRKGRRSNPRSPSDTMSTMSRASRSGSVSPTSTYNSSGTFLSPWVTRLSAHVDRKSDGSGKSVSERVKMWWSM